MAEVTRSFWLETERLRFGRWSPSDLDLAATLWGDPAVTALIDARRALSRDQVAARLAAELETDRRHGMQYWPVFARDGDLVGCCGLRPYRPADRVAEIGVHLRPAYWGSGLAQEAATAVIEYAFHTLELAALFAGHHPANEPSRRLLGRLGFRYTHDEPYPATGLAHPSYLLEAVG